MYEVNVRLPWGPRRGGVLGPVLYTTWAMQLLGVAFSEPIYASLGTGSFAAIVTTILAKAVVYKRRLTLLP